MPRARRCKLCRTDIAHLRVDAKFCGEGCSKRWKRGERPPKPRTRKPTRYRVFSIDLALGELHPVGEVAAHDRETAIVQAVNGSAGDDVGGYVAIPLRSLRLYDAAGRKVPG